MATLNGVLRSIDAAARRSEREAERSRRELEKRRKHLEKMHEQERAAYEVEVYENLVDRLTTLHRDCGVIYDWQAIANEQPPAQVVRYNKHEVNARNRLQNYKAGFFDRLFNREEQKRKTLQAQVEQAVWEDEQEYQKALLGFRNAAEAHKNRVEFAEIILQGNLEYFRLAVEEFCPFSEIIELGSEVQCSFTSASRARLVIQIHGNNVIPRQQKSLLKSGKLSVKELPQGKFNELYQDYVCSAILRVGREILALLPLEEVVVTGSSELLNQTTGRIANQAVLSVMLVRQTMEKINFDLIDPSDCMANFKHNMGFKKSLGMSAVDELN